VIYVCGIVGIIGTKNVSHEIYRALLALQHRGQDAAGMLTFDGEEPHLKKGLGLVNEVFDEKSLKELDGPAGIGHVRYPTIGSTSALDAQPFVTYLPYGIGLAHNGNILNFGEIKRLLSKKYKRKLRSTCDGEELLKLLAAELGSTFDLENVYDSIENLMNVVNGSYSVVALMTNKGLLGFRDPHAIRPMIFGEKRNGKGYIFASESVVLDVLGYRVIKDLEPGEAIFIDRKLKVHSKVIKGDERKHCFFEWIYFSRADSVIEDISVYEARLNLGKELAKLWKGKVDMVMPVPDTSIPAAISFSEETGLRYREGLIKNRYVGRTFIMASQKKRIGAVKDKINPMIRDKKLVMIDDSIVRGTTSRRMVEMLRKAGADEVHLLSTCPPLRNPCVYGIDFPTKEELVASDKEVEDIRNIIGCDSLIYQTLEGMVKAIGIPKENLCTACLTGNYPTKIGENDIEKFEEMRKKERNEK
jgi:amidophosphoribosyltransferase